MGLPRHTSVRSPRPLVAVALLMAVLLGSGCIPARAGRRCNTQEFGSQGNWVLQCRNGRWARLMTNHEAAKIYLAALNAVPANPVRVIVGGDSTGSVFAHALIRYSHRFPHLIQVVDATMVACPLTINEEIRMYDGEPPQRISHCGLWALSLPERVRQLQPDAALVFFSMMEQSDQRTSAAEPWRSVLDPEWAARQRTFYHHYADQLSASGAGIFWADVPTMRLPPGMLPWVADQPARSAALNASYAQFAAERGDVEVLPLMSRVGEPFTPRDRVLRPDGVHFSDAAADAEVANWLVPMLLERFR